RRATPPCRPRATPAPTAYSPASSWSRPSAPPPPTARPPSSTTKSRCSSRPGSNPLPGTAGAPKSQGATHGAAAFLFILRLPREGSSCPMPLAEQLTAYGHAAFSGLWVQTSEPDEAEREIAQLARARKWRLAVWDVAGGLRIPGAAPGSGGAPDAAGDPLAAPPALPALARRGGPA